MHIITEGKYIDLFVTYRFLRILTIPWEEQDAFKLGIIDAEGKRVKSKKIASSDDKNAYTMLHRLVFNFKRILSKIPLVKSKLGTYAAALFLLKESMDHKEYNILMEYIIEKGEFGYELEALIENLNTTQALCLLEEENMKTLDEVTLKEAKSLPVEISYLGPAGQFALINDFLGIRQNSGIRPFEKDSERAEKVIKANDISGDLVKKALAKMEKDGWFKEDIDEDAPANNMGDGNIADKDNVMNLDGRSKTFKAVMRRIKERKLKEKERLIKAKLSKMGISEDKIDEEEYEEFFQNALKKFKVKDIANLSDDEKKKFFNYVDKNWDAGSKETD